MRLPPRRVLTTSNKKRKEEDHIHQVGVDAVIQPSMSTARKLKPAQSQLGSDKESGAASSSHLLAGYLAHEFLTKGTLFGQPWDAVRADDTGDLALEPVEETKQSREGEAEARDGAEPCLERFQRYVAVADLISSDGAHFAGVVNPTQLARLLQM
ncbi:embryo sac development arrest protein [Parasponia andersonii]|uniref:Embryo sac development arrest protein n=1 Tax=Parasponia andersonii TaxID=3476 RepID=A0A2P5AE01_PARAD|nr:embryo sac development arrest protein [Parasponia andersonii]